MNPDATDIAWVTERLPDVPPADGPGTERARLALIEHIAAATPTPAPARRSAARDRRRPRRRRVVQLGLGVVGGAAAATVVGTNLTGAGHATGSPAVAQAAIIKARARQAVAPAPGSILEIALTSTQTTRGRPSDSWSERLWTSTTAPYANREIQTSSDGPVAESAVTADGRQQVYDPATNTVYTYAPHYAFRPGRTPGTETLTVAEAQLVPTEDTPKSATLPARDAGRRVLTLSAGQVRALKLGEASVGFRRFTSDAATHAIIATGPRLVRDARPTNPAAGWRATILRLLDSPDATVNRSAHEAGRPAIEITRLTHSSRAELRTSHTVRTSFWVAPGTYRPLREVETSVTPSVDGPTERSTVTTTFPTWRRLTGSAASPGLLSLAARHPSARRVDADESTWSAVQARLYPHG